MSVPITPLPVPEQSYHPPPPRMVRLPHSPRSPWLPPGSLSPGLLGYLLGRLPLTRDAGVGHDAAVDSLPEPAQGGAGWGRGTRRSGHGAGRDHKRRGVRPCVGRIDETDRHWEVG